MFKCSIKAIWQHIAQHLVDKNPVKFTDKRTDTVQQILRVLRQQHSAKLSMGGVDQRDLKAPVPPYVAGIPGYVATYENSQTLMDLSNFYATLLDPIVENMEGSVGADVGCWFGVPTYLISTVGPSKVIGFDIDDEFVKICEAWRSQLAIEGIAFFNLNALLDQFAGEFHWILINQVLCNALPDSFDRTLEMACGALMSGGKLIVCDSNNPWCADTRERLSKQFQILEVGDGSIGNSNGEFFRLRKSLISEHFVELDAKTLERFAEDTCYMWGSEVIEYCRRALAGVWTEKSRFVSDWKRSPIEPNTGAASGNISDPYLISDQLTSLGLKSYITTSTAVRPPDAATVEEMLKISQGFFVVGEKS